MHHRFFLSALFLAVTLIVLGCSSTSAPIAPSDLSGFNQISQSQKSSQTHLWGYYDIYIDIPTQTVHATLNRQVMFTANVVNFINGKVSNLGFKINDTPTGPDYIDVDIDVTIKHPFPGLPQYHGYDVRGVFMGDGSETLAYNSDLVYAVLGTDQFMLPDEDDGIGGPDGYTRWFNKAEFSTGGMPLFSYTQGKLASPGFNGTATLNPYKYYADGLGVGDDLWTWLTNNADKFGRFSSGASNTRNYYLRFPNSKGVKYGYAITANWEGEAPELHPSNAPEAVALKVVDKSNVYYASPTDKGGKIKLDISVWDWDAVLSAGVMEDYKIFLESSVLSSVYQFTSADMLPKGGNENYSTYSVEIPATSIVGPGIQEYWLIIEEQGEDYTNDFGVSNLAGTDPLAAFYRYNLIVGTSPTNSNPVCDLKAVTSMPVDDFNPVLVSFDASGSYDPDGDPITFEWDFDGDGIFGEDPDDFFVGTPDKPSHPYYTSNQTKVSVKVKDNKGGESICDLPVNITARPSKNLDITYSGASARDICIDHSNGNLYALYSNGKTRIYTYSSFYTNSTEFSNNVNNLYIDISPVDDVNGKAYLVMGRSETYPSSPTVRLDHLDSAGNLVYAQAEGYGCTQPGDGVVIKDVFAMGSNGERKYAHACVLYWDAYGNAGSWKGAHMLGREYLGNPPYSTMLYYINYIQWGMATPSGSQVYSPWIRGAESDRNGDWVWYVEAVDCTASRWVVPPRSLGPGNYYAYAGPFFGVPGQPGDQDNRLNDPLDITRDKDNQFYVLDRLSTGAYTIKAFTYTSSSTTAKGSFGKSSDWNLTPSRIEGSDWNGNVVVLHTSGTNSMVSVFTEYETP